MALIDEVLRLCKRLVAAEPGWQELLRIHGLDIGKSSRAALEAELANIKWLITRHCDLTDPLADLETRVRAISDSSRMDQFAATLARLRQTH